jgi:hypothetical protein
VLQTASELQAVGLLRTDRGHIKLLKRKELKKRACPCYEIVRRHVDRLLLDSASNE